MGVYSLFTQYIGVPRATVLHEDHHQLEAISKPQTEVPSLSRLSHAKLTLPPLPLGIKFCKIFMGFWRQVEWAILAAWGWNIVKAFRSRVVKYLQPFVEFSIVLVGLYGGAILSIVGGACFVLTTLEWGAEMRKIVEHYVQYYVISDYETNICVFLGSLPIKF